MAGVPIEAFSVRWDGYIVPTVSDRYRLFTYAGHEIFQARILE